MPITRREALLSALAAASLPSIADAESSPKNSVEKVLATRHSKAPRHKPQPRWDRNFLA